MKKYLLLVLIATSGCQKLDPEFLTVTSKEQIVTNFENMEGMLSSLYTDLPDGLYNIWGGNGAALMAAATDEAEYTYETNPVQYFNTGSWNAAVNPDDAWAKYNRAIRKVNQFLEDKGKIDFSRWKDDPERQEVYKQNLDKSIRWEYEARFLRAFYYFELVKRYGGVPILTHSLSLNEDFSAIKRNTLEECIDFIVQECDTAALHLPLDASMFPYVLANDLGRVTKLSALALKSRVLIYAASELFNNTSWSGGYAKSELISMPIGNRSERWRAASNVAKEIIDLTSGITFASYRNLFTTNVFDAPEIFLCRRYPSTNSFEQYNYPVGIYNGQGGTNPSQNLVDAYEVKVDENTSRDFDWSNPAMANNPYENRDPRLELSVIVNNATFGNPARNVEIWNDGRDAPPLQNATKTGYYIKKYVHELNLNTGGSAVHGWIIFRLSEIFLNYAEALNEYSPGHPDIKIYYDKVRSRSDVNMPGLPDGLTQSEIREKIRQEKRVEFAFEDHRFWDVRRWMMGEILGADLRGVRVSKSGNNFLYMPFVVESRIFLPKMYLYPIPQSDININGNLDQNPMW